MPGNHGAASEIRDDAQAPALRELGTEPVVADRIRAGEALGRNEITRADVAATIVAVLVADDTIGRTFEILNDGVPIMDALEGVSGG